MKLLLIFIVNVIEVIDGDIFRREVNLGFDITITRHFRVYGIDAPEIFRPMSDSKLYNSKAQKMIPHIHLQIETIDPMVLMK